MIKNPRLRIKLVAFSLFVFYSLIYIGWYLSTFIYIYFPLDESLVGPRLNQINLPQVYLVSIGLSLTLLTYFLKVSPFTTDQKPSKQVQRLLLLQLIYLFLSLLDWLMVSAGQQIDILRLIMFIFGIDLLRRWAVIFLLLHLPGWDHPTTFGSFILTAALGGLAMMNLFKIIDLNSPQLKILFIILLFFDLLILYARFQYLSTSGTLTNQIARELMGSQLLFFGMRIIVGIFMPLIFILYSLLTKATTIEGVPVLVLFGLLLDRYLFFKSGLYQ